ncbi:hypothetical protein [Mycoplasma zalophi]|uniref:hypothetical protein n=1 Tax=Mycoplasma zalophi TaxID=191287 RepID=UPI001C12693C|nr:hypothetical protein [Mycoplasma zalophi]MBU4690836.1 hypothetical protein [Mycoplasma zalophi]
MKTDYDLLKLINKYDIASLKANHLDLHSAKIPSIDIYMQNKYSVFRLETQEEIKNNFFWVNELLKKYDSEVIWEHIFKYLEIAHIDNMQYQINDIYDFFKKRPILIENIF